ncbi:hypothetical protein KSS87_008608 [Heliosperma pusillum]|nr:hypothetical protein KSS87_008608 [Heliosperma pusillum]
MGMKLMSWWGPKTLDPLSNFEGQKASPMLESCEVATDSKTQWKQMGEEGKKVAVQEEMRRMHHLPVNSSYATHRIRVLNKILQLMSIQRSASQEEELELLFAGLSL